MPVKSWAFHEVKHPAANQDILQYSFSCYSAPGGSCQPFQVVLLGVTNLHRVINDIDLTEVEPKSF